VTRQARYERRTKSRGFLDVAPELVVEILSPERPNTDRKVVEYLTIGVRLVLVVDPPGQTISAHRPNDTVEHYRKPDALPCDDVVVPGFSLPVVAVFEI
jgi:Uma2 family endonuclease